MKYGKLTVRSLVFELADGAKAKGVTVTLAGKTIPAKFAQDGIRVKIKLSSPAQIETGQTLKVEIE